jgi:hypothetical protein
MEIDLVAPQEVTNTPHIDRILAEPGMPEMHDPLKVGRIVGYHLVQVLKTTLDQIRTQGSKIILEYHQPPEFMYRVFENNVFGIEIAQLTPVSLLQILKLVFETFQQVIFHGRFGFV